MRVPVEVVKQRRQAGDLRPSLVVANQAWRRDGLQGLYRGGLTTLAREVPFSLIQFPLWELLKANLEDHRGRPSTPIESAACGALGGIVAVGKGFTVTVKLLEEERFYLLRT